MFRMVLLPLILALCACTPQFKVWAATLHPGDLQCENLQDPLGIESTLPRLSWRNSAGYNGAAQTAWRVIASSTPALLEKNKGDIWDSGKVTSPESVLVQWNGRPLKARDVVYWKVQTWNEKDQPSRWSRPARFSIGLVEPQYWQGRFMGLSPEAGDPHFPQFRYSFSAGTRPAEALLHVNSLGYHEVYINGRRVGDAVLSPAVSQLNKRSLIVTYDVAPYLQKGTNTLALWLGTGWFNEGLPGVDHAGPVVRAQLEALQSGSWKTLAATGPGWKARSSEISGIGNWRPHKFGGEKVDSRQAVENFGAISFDDTNWHEASIVTLPERLATPQKVQLNRIQRTFSPVEVRALTNGSWLVDFGTTLTGWIEIDLGHLDDGREVTMDYFDCILPDGKLNDEFQKDVYIGNGKAKQTFRNRFNYHGFRYVRISNLPEKPSLKSLKAFLIHTDYRSASSFKSSDDDINKIHDMVFYTLRCLSLGGDLVDCPHIERLGYGGDGNASTLTAQTMFNLGPLYANWLDAWSDCARPDGGMPHTAPNPYPAGGGPYWCGFIITASWQSYVHYGDIEILRRHYPVMKQWLGYVKQHSPDGLLAPWPDTEYRNWYLGDWASPPGINDGDRRSVDLVANSYIVVCLGTMEKIATILGNQEDAAAFKRQREFLAKKVHQTFYTPRSGIYADGDQVDQAFPLVAGIVPPDCTNDVVQALMRTIAEKNGGHLATGLVGVPVMTQWATESRPVDLMYSMLKQRSFPGYLFMLDNGATTTWEHWNGSRSRIHNCFNGVGSWFYQSLGGLRPLENFPAYRRFSIDPQVPGKLTWARLEKDCPYGMIRVNWEKKQSAMTINATVPVGSEAEVAVPSNATTVKINGKAVAQRGVILLPSGAYRIEWNL